MVLTSNYSKGYYIKKYDFQEKYLLYVPQTSFKSGQDRYYNHFGLYEEEKVFLLLLYIFDALFFSSHI